LSAQIAAPSQLISVWINGELKEVPENLSLAGLLERLGIASERVAVELNRSVVRKRDWQDALITAASHIEIVEFVGGG
jgi:sulfur carrier protein